MSQAFSQKAVAADLPPRGRVHLYRDSNGLGEYVEMVPGTIFGEQTFRHGGVAGVASANNV